MNQAIQLYQYHSIEFELIDTKERRRTFLFLLSTIKIIVVEKMKDEDEDEDEGGEDEKDEGPFDLYSFRIIHQKM